MKNNRKTNACGLIMMNLLYLLYEEQASYKNIVELFKDENNSQSINNIQVQINKYLNVLKVFGIEVIKEKNTYTLTKRLTAIKLTPSDIKTLGILFASVKNLPSEIIAGEIHDFIKMFEVRMTKLDRKIFTKYVKTLDYEFSFFFSSFKEQLKICHDVCEEKFLISITCLNNDETKTYKGKPIDVVYDLEKARLKIYDIELGQENFIPVNSILSIIRFPQITNGVERYTTVVYKLKGKLAKRYKLKDNEHSEGFDAEGNLIVVNHGENSEHLRQRLFRYMYDCEVITPAKFRDEMMDMIIKTIENYY